VAHLIVLLVSLALLAGFFLLTQHEARQGVRFFAARRDAFDTQVERIEFVVEHVDLGAFAREEIRHATNRTGHAIANLSLQAVRAVERLLTRAVRYLRVRHEVAAPRESAREFVKTLSDFKDGLKATHPDIDSLEVK
jgi:hypothetical protein